MPGEAQGPGGPGQTRVLAPAPNVLAFYDGRVAGYRVFRRGQLAVHRHNVATVLEAGGGVSSRG